MIKYSQAPDKVSQAITDLDFTPRVITESPQERRNNSTLDNPTDPTGDDETETD